MTKRWDKVLKHARRAVQLDGADYIAYLVLCFADLRQGEYAEGLAAAIRSAQLNPFYAHAYNVVGVALGLMGRADEALSHIEKARTLSPNDPRMNLFLTNGARAHFAAARYEAAEDWARRASSCSRTTPCLTSTLPPRSDSWGTRKRRAKPSTNTAVSVPTPNAGG